MAHGLTRKSADSKSSRDRRRTTMGAFGDGNGEAGWNSGGLIGRMRGAFLRACLGDGISAVLKTGRAEGRVHRLILGRVFAPTGWKSGALAVMVAARRRAGGHCRRPGLGDGDVRGICSAGHHAAAALLLASAVGAGGEGLRVGDDCGSGLRPSLAGGAGRHAHGWKGRRRALAFIVVLGDIVHRDHWTEALRPVNLGGSASNDCCGQGRSRDSRHDEWD